jgi:hypothetical protein
MVHVLYHRLECGQPIVVVVLVGIGLECCNSFVVVNDTGFNVFEIVGLNVLVGLAEHPPLCEVLFDTIISYAGGPHIR